MRIFPRIAPVLLYGVLLAAGCDQRMEEQPRYDALEAAPRLPGGIAAQPPPPGTIATSQPLAPSRAPASMTRADLRRGAERFAIYCVPCHGILGRGDGAVVQRGFPAPPSYHLPRLREAPLAHFYQVMSEGYGVMFSYADRVAPQDRWRIAWYIRALQQSQNTELARYPALRARFEQNQSPGDQGNE